METSRGNNFETIVSAHSDLERFKSQNEETKNHYAISFEVL